MITTQQPIDWRDLQRQVGRILAECGFEVEVERIIATARGNVEVDVDAVEEIAGRRYRVLCECKHWVRNVPQEVIFAFRTVLADVGANQGYVVSSAGFQPGARAAVEHTNVRLVTWEEFQQEFEPSWLDTFLRRHVVERIDPLFSFVEPLFPAWFPELGEAAQAEYIRLHDRYQDFGWLMMGMTPYAKRPLPQLPLSTLATPAVIEAGEVPAEMLDAIGWRELLDVAIPYGEAAIAEFRALRPPAWAPTR